ncbi:MAG: hypothetical protein B7X93_00720 [Hydrogenophilales bacterium 17-61-9]|nr:MAG: hypothetical protein B7X93_00720 [Hydrogenophilales bacterium 17-61-9]
MHPRRIRPLLALTLALCLTLAQLAVAAHGVVHPWEKAGNAHSPACQHLVGHGLGSALPGSNTLHFASAPGLFVASAPQLPFFGSVTCRYQARAPPLASPLSFFI